MTATIPEGFARLHLRPNPYIDACGPLYGRRDGDRLVLGLRVERRHCNPGGTCHGGMLGTLADMLLVLGASAQTGDTRYMLTVSLSCDYVGPAPEGSWLEGRLDVLRRTRSLVFCQGRFAADGAPVLRCSGIAKPSGEPDPSFTLGAWAAEIEPRVGPLSGPRQGAARSPGWPPGQAWQRRMGPESGPT